MYQYDYSPLASRRMQEITKRNPRLAKSIIRKIEWLVKNAETIAHQRLKLSPYYSLHSASYRIAYALHKTERYILIILVSTTNFTTASTV